MKNEQVTRSIAHFICSIEKIYSRKIDCTNEIVAWLYISLCFLQHKRKFLGRKEIKNVRVYKYTNMHMHISILIYKNLWTIAFRLEFWGQTELKYENWNKYSPCSCFLPFIKFEYIVLMGENYKWILKNTLLMR